MQNFIGLHQISLKSRKNRRGMSFHIDAAVKFKARLSTVIRVNIASRADSNQLYDFAISRSLEHKLQHGHTREPLPAPYLPKMLFGVSNVCTTFIPLQAACTSRLQMLRRGKCSVTRVKYDVSS